MQGAGSVKTYLSCSYKFSDSKQKKKEGKRNAQKNEYLKDKIFFGS